MLRGFGRLLTLGIILDARDMMSAKVAFAGRNLDKMSVKARDAALAMGTVGRATVAALAGGVVLSAWARATKEAADFETVMTNLARVSGRSTDEISELGHQFKIASGAIPASAHDLGLVATELSRLGLAVPEAGKMADVSKRIVMFGTAASMAQDSAVEGLARMLMTFPELRNEFTRAEDGTRVMDRISSSLLKMDVTTGGTAESIMRMTMRFGGLFQAMNGTIDQAFALSGAIQNSLPKHLVEPAGTAIMNIFDRITKKGGEWAKFLGVSTQKIDRFARGLDQPVELLQLMADRINVAAENDENLSKHFDELGLNLARTKPVLLALAAASKTLADDGQTVLNRALSDSAEAFASGTEVMMQYEKAMTALNAKIQMMKSAFQNFVITAGEPFLVLGKGIVTVLTGIVNYLNGLPPIVIQVASVAAAATVGVVTLTLAFAALGTGISIVLNKWGHWIGAAKTPFASAMRTYIAQIRTGTSGVQALAMASNQYVVVLGKHRNQTIAAQLATMKLKKGTVAYGEAFKKLQASMVAHSVVNARVNGLQAMMATLNARGVTSLLSLRAAVVLTTMAFGKLWAVLGAGRWYTVLIAASAVFTAMQSGSEAVRGLAVAFSLLMLPVMGFWRFLAVAVAGLLGQLQAEGFDVMGWLKELGGALVFAFEPVMDIVKQVAEAFTGLFRALFGGEKSKGKLGWLKDFLVVVLKIVNVIASVVRAIFKVISGIVSLVTGTLGWLFSGIGALFGATTEQQKEIRGSSYGWQGNLWEERAPKKMAAGGIAVRPTRALVGEAGTAEAVLPLNDRTFAKLGLAIAAAMEDTQRRQHRRDDRSVVVKLDPDPIAKAVAKAVADAAPKRS